MVHFTRKAIQQVYDLRRSLDRENSTLRVAVIGGCRCAGLEYFVGFDDDPTEDDVCMEVEGLPVCIDPISYQEIKGATVDYVDSSDGSGFVVALSEEKSAQPSCGCPKRTPSD